MQLPLWMSVALVLYQHEHCLRIKIHIVEVQTVQAITRVA